MKTALATLRSRLSLVRNKTACSLQAVSRGLSNSVEAADFETARVRLGQLESEDAALRTYAVLAVHVEDASAWAASMYTTKTMRPEWRRPLASFAYLADLIGNVFPELVVIQSELRRLYGDQFVDEATDEATARESGVNPRLLRIARSPETRLVETMALAQVHSVVLTAAEASAMLEFDVLDGTSETAVLLPRRQEAAKEHTPFARACFACFP